MTEKLLKSVVDNMVKNGLVDKWTEQKEHTSEGHTINVDEENDEDFAISSEGVRYSKSAVITYLTEKGYQFTQANIDAAAKILSSQGDALYIPGTTSYVKEVHHTLENSDETEIMQYINFKILDEISKLRDEIINENIVEYAVETVYDTSSGVTDIQKFNRVLSSYSAEGWKLKCTFTNELGKNSVSVGGIGVNSTMDQLILIFERPKFWSDKKKDLLRKK